MQEIASMEYTLVHVKSLTFCRLWTVVDLKALRGVFLDFREYKFLYRELVRIQQAITAFENVPYDLSCLPEKVILHFRIAGKVYSSRDIFSLEFTGLKAYQSFNFHFVTKFSFNPLNSKLKIEVQFVIEQYELQEI